MNTNTRSEWLYCQSFYNENASHASRYFPVEQEAEAVEWCKKEVKKGLGAYCYKHNVEECDERIFYQATSVQNWQ